MDTQKFNELKEVHQELQTNKIQELQELEDMLLDTNIPVAQKVHEVLTLVNDLYNYSNNIFSMLEYEHGH